MFEDPPPPSGSRWKYILEREHRGRHDLNSQTFLGLLAFRFKKQTYKPLNPAGVFFWPAGGISTVFKKKSRFKPLRPQAFQASLDVLTDLRPPPWYSVQCALSF